MNKQSLLQKIKAIDGLSPNEKADLLALLHQNKKYGLVWDDKPENPELFETENRTPEAGYRHRISTRLPR